MEEGTGAPPRGGGSRTVAQMVVVGAVASALGILLGLAIEWFPEQGSTQAKDIDTLWDVLVIVSVPIFVLVCVVVLFAVRDFRMRPGEEDLDGPPIHGSTRLEVIWTAIPAVLLVALCGYAYVVLEDIEEAPAKAERQITVIGEQFTWTFEYREGGKTFRTNQLYVPQGESVRFNVRSKDVIHDFWVPEWRMKIDAVPGLTTKIRVTPSTLGRKKIVCAELCGLGHAYMRQTAHVLEPAKFDEWVRKQVTPAAPAPGAEGQTASIDAKAIYTQGNRAQSTPCAACHTLADAGSQSETGPSLDVVLKNQTKEQVVESIVKPDAKTSQGFGAGIMPSNYGSVLSPEEVDALAEYLLEVTK